MNGGLSDYANMTHSQPTIDKVPFRLTIPALASVIVATAVLVGMFYKLQTQITVAQAGIAAIIQKIEEGNAQHEQFINQLKDHETRISRLEGRK